MHVVAPVVMQLKPPGVEVAVYAVIAEPPLEADPVQETVTCVLPAIPVTEVGASGVVLGVTEEEAVDAKPVPEPFVAVTVKV